MERYRGKYSYVKNANTPMNKDYKIYPSFKSVEFGQSRHFMSQNHDRNAVYQIIQKNKSSSNLKNHNKMMKPNMKNENYQMGCLTKFQPKASLSKKSRGMTYRINVPKGPRDNSHKKHQWNSNPATKVSSPRAEIEKQSTKDYFKFKRRAENSDNYDPNFRQEHIKSRNEIEQVTETNDSKNLSKKPQKELSGYHSGQLMLRSKMKRMNEAKTSNIIKENYNIDGLKPMQSNFSSLSGTNHLMSQNTCDSKIPKFIDHNSTPSSFFNDPTVLKTYIDNKLQDAKGFQTSEATISKENSVDRRVMTNQANYRRVGNSKKLSNTTNGYSNQRVMTQSSFFKNPKYHSKALNVDIMRQNTIVKVDPNSKRRFSNTQDGFGKNRRKLEDIPDIQKKNNIAIGRIPLKTTKRRIIPDTSTPGFTNKISTNRSLDLGHGDSSDRVAKGFNLSSKQVRCKSKEMRRNRKDLKFQKLPTPLKDKEDEVQTDFQPTKFPEENEYRFRISDEKIISFPKREAKLKSLEPSEKLDHSPYKLNKELSPSQSIQKNQNSTKSSQKPNRIIDFGSRCGVSTLFPGTMKNKNMKLKKSSYEFPKKLHMFGIHNLKKFKNQYLKKQPQEESYDEVEIINNFEHENFKSLITSVGACSKVGKSLSHPLKPNQDSFIQRPNMILSQQKSQDGDIINQTHLFGVLDGHGINGHKISGTLKNKLPTMIKISMNSEPESLEQMLIDTVTKVDKDLDKHRAFNSGSTCCLALIHNKTLYFSNTGDSRALLIRIPEETKDLEKEQSSPKIKYTEDHSCDVKAEQKRILDLGGRIERCKGNIKRQPLRVWLPNEDAPGLAMTRSVGDHIVREVGVICTPEIQIHPLQDQKYILVIGSDGIYEYISNKEMVKYAIDNQNLSATELSKRIVEIARERWKSKDVFIDDCTCQIVYIDAS
ncbi:unnamed protein product [Moneuplotes crassus]|uniref:PPM-type phosphatase domain-containing protein n=1 Tax=Euplotes crassus TaxID=5936 RepID=A0AAD1XMF1_EUPCR|nr:unnamed protein product [Moneuplotes crassus]